MKFIPTTRVASLKARHPFRGCDDLFDVLGVMDANMLVLENRTL